MLRLQSIEIMCLLLTKYNFVLRFWIEHCQDSFGANEKNIGELDVMTNPLCSSASFLRSLNYLWFFSPSTTIEFQPPLPSRFAASCEHKIGRFTCFANIFFSAIASIRFSVIGASKQYSFEHFGSGNETIYLGRNFSSKIRISLQTNRFAFAMSVCERAQRFWPINLLISI